MLPQISTAASFAFVHLLTETAFHVSPVQFKLKCVCALCDISQLYILYAHCYGIVIIQSEKHHHYDSPLLPFLLMVSFNALDLDLLSCCVMHNLTSCTNCSEAVRSSEHQLDVLIVNVFAFDVQSVRAGGTGGAVSVLGEPQEADHHSVSDHHPHLPGDHK